MTTYEELSNSRKRQRKLLNTLFVDFDKYLLTPEASRLELMSTYDLLVKTSDKIAAVDDAILALLISTKSEDKILDEEQIEVKKWMLCAAKRKVQYEDIIKKLDTASKHGNGDTTNSIFKYHKIELRKFGGDIRQWITWWAQFEKIHEDGSLSLTDKFNFLIQCMTADSEAKRIVDSYPVNEANYSKVIGALRDRYGRPELLSETYVQDYIRLVIHRATSKEKVTLAELYDDVTSRDNAISSLDISSDKYVDILKTALVEACLPTEILPAWQRKEKGNKKNIYEQLVEFIRLEVHNEQRRCLQKDVIGGATQISGVKAKAKKERGNNSENVPTAAGLVTHQGERRECCFCKRNHLSEDCYKARSMSFEEKRRLLTKAGVCFVCMKYKHLARDCKAKITCAVCKRRHLPILCPDVKIKDQPKPKDEEKSDCAGEKDAKAVDTLMRSTTSGLGIPLQTMTVRMIGGEIRQVRVLLDSGAQRSCVLTRTAQKMGYEPVGKEKLTHTLFGGGKMPEREHTKYTIVLESIVNDYRCKFDCLDQPTICGNILSVGLGFCTDELKQKGIRLPDGDQGSADIDVLIGNDVYGKLLTGRVEQLSCGLTAVETKLGWVLSGKLVTRQNSIYTGSAMATTMSLFNDASVAELWSLEAIGIRDDVTRKTNKELEAEAKRYFLETVRRDNEGRYVVQLPWTLPPENLGDNRVIAEKRLATTTKRLKAIGLFDVYSQIFEEWMRDGIIEIVPEEEEMSTHCHYLPHRAVVKPGSSTTKVRPVFDASCKGKQNISLNDCLQKGPNLLELLPAIVLRFREGKIGAVSDIRKAFLQIGVAEHHRDYLRFLWWEDGETRLRVYRHKRVVFGVNCSPFLLEATIDYHLSQGPNEDRRPSEDRGPDEDRRLGEKRGLRRKIAKSMYVDNCVASVDSIRDLKRFVEGAVKIFQNARMELVGWESSAENYNEITEGTAQETTAVLGLRWDKRRDTLGLNLELGRTHESVTKRVILSEIQRLFDPLGFIAPVTLRPKLLLQEAWVMKIGWDQPVPEEIKKRFEAWMRSLKALEGLSIPRRFTDARREDASWELHVFCDASGKAYATAAYLRSEGKNGVTVQMLMAKARVAPLKKVTITRMELLACLIGARLKTFVLETLELEVKTVMWSDSSTAISWIQRQDNWGVFVENRAREIRNLTSPEEWRHVPGICNPADLPSRGCDAEELVRRRWWEGPEWLKRKESEWPVGGITPDEELIAAEKRRTIVTTMAAVAEDWYDWKFSRYRRVVCMVAYMLRWRRLITKKTTGALTADEINSAEKTLFRMVQQEFQVGKPGSEEIKLIRTEDGLWRVVTKITERNDLMTFQYPILLPEKSKLVRLLIREVHERNCHAGVQVCMRLLRQMIWIPRARQTIKRIVMSCMRCKRFAAKSIAPEETSLPVERVKDTRVFDVIGVDLAGPLYLRGGQKVWIVLFTCAVYRAIHLELVASLSTEAFLKSFRRFVARRGRPTLIFSDQGTNFVGAANLLGGIDWDAVKEKHAVEKIEWRFNPPAAPWWGGFWERLIRIVKGILVRMLGRNSLDMEELTTLLCEVEAIVNARPLTYISEDVDDLVVLAPEMFITGAQTGGLPEVNEIRAEDLRGRYRHRKRLMEDLRQRFRNEYLSTLAQRVKEKRRNRELRQGDIVLIGSEFNKRLFWPLGRIIEIYPGRDGVVRVVKLRTSDGVLVRPVQRLYPLEMEVQEGDVVYEDAGLEEGTKVQAADEEKNQAVQRNEAAVVRTRSGRRVRAPSRFNY